MDELEHAFILPVIPDPVPFFFNPDEPETFAFKKPDAFKIIRGNIGKQLVKLKGFKSIIDQQFQRLRGISFSPETFEDQDPDTGPLMSRFKFKKIDGTDGFYPVFRM